MARSSTPAVQLTHAANERATLTEFLDLHRWELAGRAADLTAEQMNLRVAASSLTLGGLVKHMAYVEDIWFTHRFSGSAPSEPFASAPWDDDPDWELTSAAEDSPEALFALFDENCARSRAVLDGVESLDQLSVEAHPEHGSWNMRWILVHMIEEYARHCGHADLLREAIDGKVG